jgi:hypothetical protein
VYVSALRATGYRIPSVDDGYDPEQTDSELLAIARGEFFGGLVIDSGDTPFGVADQLEVPRAEVYLALAYHYANLTRWKRFTRRTPNGCR